MGDEIFSVYLTPADYSKLAYAKLDLPASPWKLLDALDKVRLSEGDSLYLEITEYADKQELEESIIRRHYGTVAEEEPPQDVPAAVGGMNHGMQAEKNSRKTILRP